MGFPRGEEESLEHDDSTSRAWRDVDSASNLAAHAHYLQSVSAQEHFQAPKRHSISLLAIQLGSCVLDVGCGVGDGVRLMAQRAGRDGRAVGIDSSALMIAEAQRRSEGLDLPTAFHVGDAARLTFPTTPSMALGRSASFSTSTIPNVSLPR